MQVFPILAVRPQDLQLCYIVHDLISNSYIIIISSNSSSSSSNIHLNSARSKHSDVDVVSENV